MIVPTSRNPKLALDLKKLERKLAPKFKDASNLCGRIWSTYVIIEDIGDSLQSIKIFWEWGNVQIWPNRPEEGYDAGPSAVVLKSLFNNAALCLARAFDEASRKRSKLDFRKHFLQCELQAEYERFDHFRNNEMAHYGAFIIGGAPYSDDNAALNIDPSGQTNFLFALRRFNSSGEIVDVMTRLANSALQFSQNNLMRKQSELLNLLNSRPEVRDYIMKGTVSELEFDLGSFFSKWRKENINYDGQGPKMIIQWT